MSIAIDISIQFAWAIANTEAFLAADRRIRPVHFLLGILKVIDPAFTKQVSTLRIPPEQQESLARTGTAARHYLEMSPEDITSFRRRLRKKIRAKAPSPDHTGPLPVLHRSDESRAVFSSLVRHAAGSRHEEVSVLTLLEELVRTESVDIETLWQEVVKGKKLPTDAKQHKWSTGRQWHVVDDAQGERPMEPDLPATLDGHGRNLTQLAKNGHLCPVLGRKREIAAVARCLHRASKRSVLLIGAPGVGKTSIVEALAQKLCRPTAPLVLRDAVMIQIAAGELLLALATGGRAAAAVRARIEALQGIDGLILAIEDLDRILKPEPRNEAAAELLRNAISRGELTCIGTTTESRFEVMQGTHDSFTQSLNSLRIAEMSAPECLPIAKQWADAIARFHGVQFADGMIETAVRLAAQKIKEGAMPAKAIDLLENAAVFCKVAMLSSDPNAPRPEPPIVSSRTLSEVAREQYGIDFSSAARREET